MNVGDLVYFVKNCEKPNIFEIKKGFVQSIIGKVDNGKDDFYLTEEELLRESFVHLKSIWICEIYNKVDRSNGSVYSTFYVIEEAQCVHQDLVFESHDDAKNYLLKLVKDL